MNLILRLYVTRLIPPLTFDAFYCFIGSKAVLNTVVPCPIQA